MILYVELNIIRYNYVINNIQLISQLNMYIHNELRQINITSIFMI